MGKEKMNVSDIQRGCELPGAVNGGCEGCFAADACARWNGTGNTVPLIHNGYIVGEDDYK